jgi:2-hydroxychromene-2-carboxylate isomerase
MRKVLQFDEEDLAEAIRDLMLKRGLYGSGTFKAQIAKTWGGDRVMKLPAEVINYKPSERDKKNG